MHRCQDKGPLGKKAWPYNSLRMFCSGQTARGLA
jgi:hypothetical protein